MTYRFLENIATADIAFEALGKTLEELFENCATALTAVMVDTETIKPISNSQFQISNKEIENLLFDFLSELVFIKDLKQLLFSKFEIKINKLDAKGYKLEADLWGEKIDPKKHQLHSDVKAITWHMFQLEKEKDSWKARVVLDI